MYFTKLEDTIRDRKKSSTADQKGNFLGGGGGGFSGFNTFLTFCQQVIFHRLDLKKY